MKRVLYVDACMRAESRTEELAAAYIRQVFPEDICSVQRIRVADLDLAPMSGEDVAARDAELAAGRTDLPAYALAREFAAADEIVVAAPFWDSSFPSKLKVYIEHICVQSVTFGYGADGRPAKLCKADLHYNGGRPAAQGSGRDARLGSPLRNDWHRGPALGLRGRFGRKPCGSSRDPAKHTEGHAGRPG